MSTEEGSRPAPRERSPTAPGAPAPPEPSAAVLVLTGPIARADIPDLCERARTVLDGCGPGPVVCDVGSLDPDAVTVDALARLQLTARQAGRRVRFRDACGELRGLLALMGLNDVLACGETSVVEAGRQAEEREQVRGVEEERDPGDPPA